MTLSGWGEFSGTGTPKANTYDNWLEQYDEYYKARFNQSGQPTAAAVAATVQQHVAPGQVALVVLSFRYDQLKANAVSSGLIRVDSAAGRLYDQYPSAEQAETSESLAPPTPYQTKRLFSVALAGIVPANGTVSVYISKDLWMGTDVAPGSIQIDFGNGSSAISVPLTSAGTYIPITFGAAARQSDAQRNTNTLATTTVTAGGLTAAAKTQGVTPIDPVPDQAIGLLASYAWPGELPAGAVGWVKWGAGNTSGKFRKPMVFVEGIDFGPANIAFSQTGILGAVELNYAATNYNYRNGEVGWNEMVAYNSDDKAVEKLPLLRQQLTDQGYDIIFLDFSDGATLIQSNAMTLVELLNWINDPAHHTTDTEETIVTAASMGGQVARFALAWMEQQGICHNAKLYVSIDSPHRGANIPPGVQALIQRLRDIFTTFGGADTKWDHLNRPAARQMLVYHADDGAATLRQQWQAWQQSAGSYPTHLRKVAIACGNGHGSSLLGSYEGQELLRTTVGAAVLNWGLNYATSLAGAQSHGRDRVVFRYTKPLSPSFHFIVMPPGTKPYDMAPGGTRTTTRDARDEHPNLFYSSSDYQTFIPAISALDVSAAGSIYDANLFYDVKGTIDPNLPNPSKYAFEAYYAPDGISEPHINITNGQPRLHPDIPTDYGSNNTAWLLNELAESAHRLPAYFDGTTHYPGTGGGSISPYNFGSLYRRLLPTVEIGSGGQLFVNNNNLPISGGVNTANDDKALSFEMYTSSCGSRVVVGYNGNLTLGQPNDTHKATVRIGNNSLVDLRSGGSVTVNAGSTLRIEKGGTLLVRSGSVLFIYGTVVIEDGGYVCIENPGNVAALSGGQLTILPGFRRGANPALALPNPPSCDPNYPSCAPSLTLTFTANNGQRTTDGDGAAGFDKEGCTRVYTVTAVGDYLGPTFTWTVTNTTTSGSTTSSVSAVPGHPNQIHLVLNASNPTRTVSVTANNSCNAQTLQATQNVTGTFPTCTQGQDGRTAVTMYPNPAGGELDFEQADPARAGDYEVSLYDGQGMLRWRGRSGSGKLHLASGSLPRGIYGVVITQGETVARRTLSLE